VTRYAVSLKQLEPWLLGVYVDAIDKTLISQIVRERRAAGVTIATIRRDLSAVSSVLDYAEDEDWCTGNPALDRLRKLKERRDPIVLRPQGH
jgi:integrase/recombinase XerD